MVFLNFHGWFSNLPDWFNSRELNHRGGTSNHSLPAYHWHWQPAINKPLWLPPSLGNHETHQAALDHWWSTGGDLLGYKAEKKKQVHCGICAANVDVICGASEGNGRGRVGRVYWQVTVDLSWESFVWQIDKLMVNNDYQQHRSWWLITIVDIG